MEHQVSDRTSHEYEIDLRFFVTVLRKCWYWILLAALILGLGAGVYSSFFIPKSYSSTVNMYVDPNPQASGGMFNTSTADALAEIYPPVLRYSDAFARSVATEMALLTDDAGAQLFPTWTYREGENGEIVPTNWSRVRSMMSTGIKDDKIFYITMRSQNPEEAYRLAEIAASVAPGVLDATVKVGQVMVLSDPVLDTVPDSPNVLRNAILAAMIGAVLVYVAFFLRDLFDTRVYTEKALAAFDLPILGTVPYFAVADALQPKSAKSDKEVEE